MSLLRGLGLAVLLLARVLGVVDGIPCSNITGPGLIIVNGSDYFDSGFSYALGAAWQLLATSNSTTAVSLVGDTTTTVCINSTTPLNLTSAIFAAALSAGYQEFNDESTGSNVTFVVVSAAIGNASTTSSLVVHNQTFVVTYGTAAPNTAGPGITVSALTSDPLVPVNFIDAASVLQQAIVFTVAADDWYPTPPPTTPVPTLAGGSVTPPSDGPNLSPLPFGYNLLDASVVDLYRAIAIYFVNDTGTYDQCEPAYTIAAPPADIIATDYQLGGALGVVDGWGSPSWSAYSITNLPWNNEFTVSIWAMVWTSGTIWETVNPHNAQRASLVVWLDYQDLVYQLQYFVNGVMLFLIDTSLDYVNQPTNFIVSQGAGVVTVSMTVVDATTGFRLNNPINALDTIVWGVNPGSYSFNDGDATFGTYYQQEIVTISTGAAPQLSDIQLPMSMTSAVWDLYVFPFYLGPAAHSTGLYANKAFYQPQPCSLISNIPNCAAGSCYAIAAPGIVTPALSYYADYQCVATTIITTYTDDNVYNEVYGVITYTHQSVSTRLGYCGYLSCADVGVYAPPDTPTVVYDCQLASAGSYSTIQVQTPSPSSYDCGSGAGCNWGWTGTGCYTPVCELPYATLVTLNTVTCACKAPYYDVTYGRSSQLLGTHTTPAGAQCNSFCNVSTGFLYQNPNNGQWSCVDFTPTSQGPCQNYGIYYINSDDSSACRCTGIWGGANCTENTWVYDFCDQALYTSPCAHNGKLR